MTYETTCAVAEHDCDTPVSERRLSRELAEKFMHRLAEDDAFRAALRNDPVATAIQYGFNIDPARLPKGGIRLPEKAVIREHLDLIARRFAESPSIVIIFNL